MGIISDRTNLRIANKIYDLKKSAHILKGLAVELTAQCNLNCRHCYMDSSLIKKNDELSTEEWTNFFTLLRKKFGKKVFISITGGEPLLRPDFFQILEHLNQLGYRPALATNGLLINEKNLFQISKCLSAISISLDGEKESHNYLRQKDVYAATVKSIKLIIDRTDLPITIKTAVYKDNLQDLCYLVEELKNIGVKYWHIFPIELWGRAKSMKKGLLSEAEYQKLEKFYLSQKNDKQIKITLGEGDSGKEKRCVAGISFCSILYNGDVVPCMQSDRPVLSPEGNITQNKFSELWQDRFKANRSSEYHKCDHHRYV